MKKLFAYLLIFICAFLFVGCSSTEMLVVENQDGSVDVYYAVTLNMEELIKNKDITETEFLQMKAQVEVEASKLIAKSKMEFRTNIAKNYKLGKISKAEYETIFNDLTYFTGWTDNTFAVKLQFKTNLSYLVYADFGNNVETEYISEKSFFTTKHIQRFVNTFGREKDIFGGKSTFEYFKSLADKYLLENFSADVIAKMPEFTMTYSYLTSNNRLHSDADETVRTLSGTLHSWEINEDNYNKEIEFYTLSANSTVWYLLALTITFTFVAIYLVVIYFKKDKNNSKKNEDNL